MHFSTTFYTAALALGTTVSAQAVGITTVAADLTSIVADIAGLPGSTQALSRDVTALGSHVPLLLNTLSLPASSVDPAAVASTIVSTVCPALDTAKAQIATVPFPANVIYDLLVAQLRAGLLTYLQSVPTTVSAPAVACLTK